MTTEYYQAVRNVTCTGVKIPSQVDFDRAKTSRKEASDKGDKSESGLHPEGGDDRYKVIMILLRSHRLSVEAGFVLPGAVAPNERSGAESHRGESPMIS